MLARIAHELFWLGRHLARAEHTARMLDAVFQASLQGRPQNPSGVRLDWGSILAIMGVDPGDGPVDRNDLVHLLLAEPDEPASVIACIGRAREAARTVRDVISAEMWESVNTTNLLLLRGDMRSRLLAGPYGVLHDVRERSALFWGLTSRTMLRDEARAFLVAGGRIESADMMLRMLRVAIPAAESDDVSGDERGGAVLDGQALALLQAVGGFQAYRRAVPAPPHARPVAQFLLFERAWPDSVAASVDSVHENLLVADESPRNASAVLRLSRLAADLDFRRRADGPDTDLARTCEQVQAELALADRDIADRYFAGATPLGVVTA
jgi:uncharacterized alpha-E superfamily protein